jgi:hypothetical protein
VEVTGGEPAAITSPALIRAYIRSQTILYVHCDDRFSFSKLAQLYKKWHIQVACNEQAPCSINELDVILRMAVQPPTKNGYSLAVCRKALELRSARFLCDTFL